MSKKTNEINRITGTIISVSIRLIILSLVILLLYEGITRGYAFGYEIFNTSAVSNPPGAVKIVEIRDTDPKAVATQLKNKGLIANEIIFVIQAKFYEYTIHMGRYELNTSMTPKDILQIMNEEPASEETEG